jgi:hypothetical protein
MFGYGCNVTEAAQREETLEEMARNEASVALWRAYKIRVAS